jgi:hypothetical protein
VNVISAARRRFSRHQYRISRATSAPNRVRGSRRPSSEPVGEPTSPPRPADPVEAAPSIARSSVALHHQSSPTSVPATIRSFTGTAHSRPSATSRPTDHGAASGVQPSTSASTANASQSARSAPASSASCSGPSSAATTANSTTARSRDRRERSPVAKALVTARLTATQVSRPRTMPASWATAAPEPPRSAAVLTMPAVAASVDRAGSPASAAANRPMMSVRRGRGSSANRAGSIDSSTPKNRSGKNTQPSTRAAPPSWSSMPAARSSSTTPGTANSA